MPDTLREKVANRLRLVMYDDDPRCMPQAEAEADAILAIFAEERKKHDCQRWSDEGMGCAICNPTARRMRDLWDDPIRQRAERAEAREAKLVEAAMEALNALLDYVPTLEKQGGSMNYGRKVIRMLTSALATVKEE